MTRIRFVPARAGMTLIEVAVVLTIVAIIAAVTVPALPTLVKREPIDEAQRSLQTLLTFARATAIQRGGSVLLTVDPANRRFWLRSTGADSLGVVDTSGTLALPPDVILSGSDKRVHFAFAPEGTISAQTLVIRAGSTAELIGVDRWTGELTISAAVRDDNLGSDHAR
jgi:prepilin-type N-terminal cleavage/methylation domain-containing protein